MCSSRRSAWPLAAPLFEVLDESRGSLLPAHAGELAMAHDRRDGGRVGIRDSVVNSHARAALGRVQLDGHHDVHADRPARYLWRRGRLVIRIDEREREAQPRRRNDLVEDAPDRDHLAGREAMLEPQRTAGSRIHLAERYVDSVGCEPTREVLRDGPDFEHQLARDWKLALVQEVVSDFGGGHGAPPFGAARAAASSKRRGG